MAVLVIDYGMGNLGSVKRALEECGANEVVISSESSDFDTCTHAILPGVGSFADAVLNLKKSNLTDRIKKLALEEKVPLLGICLGMQLLASDGKEHGNSEGLNLIPGTVIPLMPISNERVPHVGWNEIQHHSSHQLLDSIPNNSDFYFVHSYHFQAIHPDHIIAHTPYCGNFTSMVAYNNIMGVQFHPEKSSKAGFQLLRNFLKF